MELASRLPIHRVLSRRKLAIRRDGLAPSPPAPRWFIPSGTPEHRRSGFGWLDYSVSLASSGTTRAADSYSSGAWKRGDLSKPTRRRLSFSAAAGLAEPKLGAKTGESAFRLHPNAPIGGPNFRRQTGGKT